MQHPPPERHAADVIFCIGDSHVSFFSGQDTIQPGWPAHANSQLPWFRVFHIGPVLAYSLARTNTQTRGREQLFEILDRQIPAESRVLLSFGEIDCRAHVVKQAARQHVPQETVVAACLDNYFQVIHQVQARGFQVIVYNAVPTRRSTPRRTTRADDFVAVGSWRERQAATCCFNAGARQRCQACGALFLENYPGLVDKSGRTDTWFYFDKIHLSQRAMPLTLRALRRLDPSFTCPPQPLTLPSRVDRVLDRVEKSLRNHLRLPRPPHFSASKPT